MTVHRDFKNKDCPGAYLMSKMPYIASEVNKLLGCSPVSGVVNSSSAPRPTKSIDDIAREVIRGSWGNGSDRKNRLEAAGYNYSVIQAKVNELLGSSSKPKPAPQPAPAPKPAKSIDDIAREVIRGSWGNGKDRKSRLEAAGYNYREVQNRVNQLLR